MAAYTPSPTFRSAPESSLICPWRQFRARSKYVSMLRGPILIVDDEKGVQSSLRGILEDDGFEAHAVSSGEDCISLMGKKEFVVVLLDVWLPGIEGVQVLQR